jgi:hypothetical protein
MTRLPEAFAQEMADYRAARRMHDKVAAWRALERAHTLSQPVLALHLKAHLEMLKYALVTRDGRELIGQMARLALAPFGSLTGRIPYGNTGRANVSAFQPMPIPDDLRAVLGSTDS